MHSIPTDTGCPRCQEMAAGADRGDRTRMPTSAMEGVSCAECGSVCPGEGCENGEVDWGERIP